MDPSDWKYFWSRKQPVFLNKEKFQGNKNKLLKLEFVIFPIFFVTGKTTNRAEENKTPNSSSGYWKYQ
jgi:hypothetical protein